jgi:hypothetical protein
VTPATSAAVVVVLPSDPTLLAVMWVIRLCLLLQLHNLLRSSPLSAPPPSCWEKDPAPLPLLPLLA